MLATQTMPLNLNHTASNLQQEVGNIMNSGQYYVTPEICRELKHINNGVDHIKLDQNFVNSSREFANKFDPSAIMTERMGANQAMSNAANTIGGVKGNIDATMYPTFTDNKVRANHHWTMQSLNGVEQELGPYAHQSIDRVKQYCDHMGVTDRYTGYRHNLNRGRRDPVRLNYQWLDTQPNEYNRSLNVGQNPSASCQGLTRVMSAPASTQQPLQGNLPRQTLVTSQSANAIQMERGPFTKSIQEQCGINTTFPGKTEYMTRYKKPNTDGPVSGFTINPSPDYTRTGRPLMRLAWDRGNTQYQTCYQWPDGSKIEKLPWLRK